MPPGLRIELFDGLRMEHGGAAVTHFRTQKTASLLAYLAYPPLRAHPRAALVEMLWADHDEDAARNSLSTAMWSLRQQIAELGLDPADVLAADRCSIRILPDSVHTDVAEFEAVLTAARAAAGPEERASALERAVELYRGELLRGFYEDWIFPEQMRLAGLFHGAARELTALLEARGELETAVRHATRAVTADPFSEEAALDLMRLYDASCQPSAALMVYRQLTRLLKQELEAVPGAEIEAFAERIAAGQRTAAQPAGLDAAPEPPALEPTGGAVPLGSRFYIVRPSDRELREAIQRGEGMLLLKGPRQTGKTSLLARRLQQAREAGARVVLTDFQSLTQTQMASPEALLRALAEYAGEQLDLQVRPADCWNEHLGPSLNLRRYMRREVLAGSEPVVWAMDEMDRLFTRDYAGEVFGLFRSWYNERALDPDGPWGRLTLVLVYATEAHLFVTDLNQSPFNVGTRVDLEDFTPCQVAELNRVHGEPFSETELRAFVELVGGHPFLVRRGLHERVRHGLTVPALEALACRGEGPFKDHLERVRVSLARDDTLYAAVRRMLREGVPPAEESFWRLRSAGLLSGAAASEARFRCRIYQEFLQRRLIDPA